MFANTWTKNNKWSICHVLRNEGEYGTFYPTLGSNSTKKYQFIHYQQTKTLLDFYLNKTTFKIALKEQLINETEEILNLTSLLKTSHFGGLLTNLGRQAV